MESLDPYQRPPEGIRNVYKRYQKMKPQDLSQDPDIVDLERDLLSESQYGNPKVEVVKVLDVDHLEDAFQKFAEGEELHLPITTSMPIPVFEHADMPGRCIFFIVQASMSAHNSLS
jgi:hypothetical protein